MEITELLSALSSHFSLMCMHRFKKPPSQDLLATTGHRIKGPIFPVQKEVYIFKQF